MTATSPQAPGLGARLARNSLHSASGRVVALLAWLVLTPPLVRALGPEGFGIWSLFYALAGWLGAMDLGFSQVALRFGAAARARESGSEAGEYATLAVLGYVLLGLVWLALALVAREPALDLLRIPAGARPLAAQAIVAGAIVFTVSGLANTTAAALQAWDRFDLANAVTVTASLAQVAGIALALVRGEGLTACLVAVAAGWLIAFLAGLLLLARGVRAFRWGTIAAALTHLRGSLRWGVPLQAANAIGVAHQQLGKLLIVRLLSLGAVVPYELALRVTSSGFTFAQLVLVAMIPEASMMHERDQGEHLQALHRRAGRFVTAAGAIMTAAVITVAPVLFEAWIGHRDAHGTLALRGLAVAAYAAVVGGVSGAIARGVGRTDLELEWAVVALVIHALLGMLLVPRIGFEGALVAIAAANGVAAVWFGVRLGRAMGWPLGRVVWDPFAVPILAVVLGSVLGNLCIGAVPSAWGAVVLTGAVSSVVTVAVLLLLRHVEWRELMSLARRVFAT